MSTYSQARQRYAACYRAVRINWRIHPDDTMRVRLVVNDTSMFGKALISRDNANTKFSGWRNPYKQAGFKMLCSMKGIMSQSGEDFPF